MPRDTLKQSMVRPDGDLQDRSIQTRHLGDTFKGVIVMWSGAIADIPTGWALCNGSNDTPDLRDRFVVCAKEDDGGVAKTNLTGSLTQSGASNVEAHVHSLGMTAGATYATGAGGTFLGQVNTGSYGTGTETYPKYYALAYIMKT